MAWLSQFHQWSPSLVLWLLQEAYGSSKRCAGQYEVMYQLLCPASRIGHIIGKASQLGTLQSV